MSSLLAADKEFAPENMAFMPVYGYMRPVSVTLDVSQLSG